MERTVTVYDAETKTYTDIPQSELAPGMVRAQEEGREGVVWIDPSQLNLGEHRHEPFEGALRNQILEIQESFPGVYEKSYEFWEDGFRRDTNPQSEVNVWLRIADTFKRFSEGQEDAYRKEVFSLVLACSNADSDSVRSVFEADLITEEGVSEIISDCVG